MRTLIVDSHRSQVPWRLLDFGWSNQKWTYDYDHNLGKCIYLKRIDECADIGYLDSLLLFAIKSICTKSHTSILTRNRMESCVWSTEWGPWSDHLRWEVLAWHLYAAVYVRGMRMTAVLSFHLEGMWGRGAPLTADISIGCPVSFGTLESLLYSH